MYLPTIFHITDRNLRQDLGKEAVIVRDYDHPAREEYARVVIGQSKGPVLIAGDIGLARRLKAGGLHVPEWQLTRFPRRFFAPKRWVITAACHSLRALKRAERHPLIQAALLSPVFETESHPNARPLGVIRFGLMARQSRLKVIALGGITHSQYRRIFGWGAYGIAMRSGGKTSPK